MACVALENAKKIIPPPPPGAPNSVPIPGSEKQGRSQVYRHWRRQEGLLNTLDPDVKTAHDFFEQSAKRVPNSNCVGQRPYDPLTKKFGPYKWETYAQLQKRRADFGVGLVLLHQQLGVNGTQYGVGTMVPESTGVADSRFGLYVSIAV